MRKVASLAILCLLVVTLSPNAYSGGLGSYPPPANGDWVITNETLVENETIVLNGNLIVETGGNLTLKNVTLKMNCVENGTYHIEVQDGGSMYILEGSNITSNTPDGSHRFNFVVREGTLFQMKDSELHESGYYIDYWIFETKGLYIETNNSKISDSFFSNNMDGITINNSDFNEIDNCTFLDNSIGVHFNNAQNNEIVNCSFSNNWAGISTFQVNNNSIINCKFFENSYATYLLGFTNATILNNLFIDNFCGLSNIYSGSILRNNTFLNNEINLGFPDFRINFDYTLDIDNSNTIDGALVYYLSNLSDVEISPDTGFEDIGSMIIMNSENISLNNIKLHNNIQGLILLNITNSKIENVSFNDTSRGIVLIGSSNNQINNCNFNNDSTGILLVTNSVNNTITNCQIIDNSKMGIWLEFGSSDNIISNCIISEGRYGIWLGRGSNNNTIRECIVSHQDENGTYISTDNNKIYHNNFISNGFHANDGGSNNQWDDGRTGGNFWDDYSGLDDGFNNRIAGDGIGDSALPHLDLDNFPFMEMDGWLTNAPLDTDSDGTWDLMDLDDDNDGYNDTLEQEEETDPLDPLSKPKDTDGDLIPDSTDPDIDDDGFPNEIDHFPQDPNKWREEGESNWSIIIAFFILLVFCFIIIGFLIRKKGKKGLDGN